VHYGLWRLKIFVPWFRGIWDCSWSETPTPINRSGSFTKTMPLAYNLTSLFCTLGAWVFFIIGCIGNSSDESSIKSAPWIRAQGDSFNLWLGTQAFVFEDATTTTVQRFRSCDDSVVSFCTACKDNGRITFALMVIAVCFALVSVILSAVSCGGEFSDVQYTTIATTGASFVMGLIGWCVFMRRCYHDVDDLVSQDLSYGAGSAISLLGFLLMGIALAVNVVSLVYAKAPGGDASTPKASTEEKPML
jgi:hypothetical protein